MPPKSKLTTDQVLAKYGVRNITLELDLKRQLELVKVPFGYETDKIKYLIPQSSHSYTPDFTISLDSGKVFYIEAKGRFLLQDQKKHLLIKKQYPELDIRFVFQNAKSKRGGSKVQTCGQWADKNGFKWAHKNIPLEWFEE